VRKLSKAKESEVKQARSIIERRAFLSDPGPKQIQEPEPINENLPPGRFDFDLAEFPVFRLCKPKLPKHDKEKGPLTYRDAIRGRGGEMVPRVWKVYPSRYGYGGPSTQVLLYDLLQLYIEQCCEGNHIQFGTLRSLFLRRGHRNPSQRDYQRMMRDIEILRGMDFHAENAFWDKERKAYVSMRWRLFNEVFYFREKANSSQTEMPFGFIEVSSVLQAIARTRGFFAIGFPSALFYQLKPLEQRLALYLAKRFKSEKIHVRFVEDLAKALPIEATKPWDVRVSLKKTAQGLLDRHLPIFSGFSVEKSGRNGEWLAIFHRKETPRDSPPPPEKRAPITPEVQDLVSHLIKASGQPEDWRWWTQCARSIGRDGVLRAIGQFEEKRRLEKLHRPGAMLSAILKDIAKQMKVTIQ
jgi:hypothetical protein